MNKSFFNRSPSVKDNNNLTISSIIAIPNPLPIEDYLRNIPMIKTNNQLILYQPSIYFTISFMDSLRVNEIKFFIQYRYSIIILCINIQETHYSGKFCDKQNILCKKSQKKYMVISVIWHSILY